MKILWLGIVFLASCASVNKSLKTNENQNEMAALFVANPTPNWTGASFKNKYHACNAVFVDYHLAVTSNTCFSSENEGTRVYNLDTIVLENKERRFTVENVFFAEEAQLIFLHTKEEAKPIHFGHQKEASYNEQLKSIGFQIYGFRRFSQIEDKAIVRATRFGNEQDGEFFIVRMKTANRVNGAALFRQNGEFAGIIAGSEKGGRALVVPADVIYRKVKEIDL